MNIFNNYSYKNSFVYAKAAKKPKKHIPKRTETARTDQEPSPKGEGGKTVGRNDRFDG